MEGEGEQRHLWRVEEEAVVEAEEAELPQKYHLVVRDASEGEEGVTVWRLDVGAEVVQRQHSSENVREVGEEQYFEQEQASEGAVAAPEHDLVWTDEKVGAGVAPGLFWKWTVTPGRSVVWI